jgi:hypothetical protein
MSAIGEYRGAMKNLEAAEAKLEEAKANGVSGEELAKLEEAVGWCQSEVACAIDYVNSAYPPY